MARPDRGGLGGALTGAAIAVALAITLRSLTGTKLLAEIVVDASTYGLQPRGFSFFLELFGALGKPLLFLSVLLGQVALYVLAWRWGGRLTRGRPSAYRVLIAAALSAGALILVTVLMVLLTNARLGSGTTWPGYVLVTVGTSIVYAIISGLDELQEASALGPNQSRRQFFLSVPKVLVGGLAVLVIGRQLLHATGGGSQTSHEGVETPEVTANKDFYIVSKNLIDPGVDANRWRLKIGGLTQQMLELAYTDIVAIPQHDQYTTFQCVSNEVNGDLYSNALWTGFSMKDLLSRAGIQSSATHVFFRSEDDYTESLPLDFAMQDEVMLVYAMNGQPLPYKHGAPLRVLAPGKYGYKQPKWLTEIMLTDHDSLGYWPQRGWDTVGRMNTSCRIDIPASDAKLPAATPVRVSGVAFSGDRGITRVEVSTNGGKSWNDAVLKPALSPYTWVLWYYDWTDVVPAGNTTILARATDGTGELQTSDEEPPYPAGATGYPHVSITVTTPRA